MTRTDALELLHWLRTQKSAALSDATHYKNVTHDIKMAQANEYKAVAYQEVIDQITSKYV